MVSSISNGVVTVQCTDGGSITGNTAAGEVFSIDASGNFTFGGVGNGGQLNILATGEVSFEGGNGGSIDFDASGNVKITPAAGAGLGFNGATPAGPQSASTLPDVIAALKAYGLLT